MPNSLDELRRQKLAELKQKAERNRLLKSAVGEAGYRWLCDQPDCDGLPHAGWDYKHARAKQHPPDANIWLALCGRGWGKTRVGAETLIMRVLETPADEDGRPTQWMVAGQTFSDTRKICVPELLDALRRRKVPFSYNRSKWEITLPDGQIIHLAGGDDPDCGRGFTLAGAWLDEVAKWRYFEEAWPEGLSLALRSRNGQPAKAILTTTPKPKLWMRAWLTDPTVAITQGSTFENAANLDPTALARFRAEYEGTRRGRQELYGEYLDDVEGALWNRGMFEQSRRTSAHWQQAILDGLIRRVVIGVDPAVTSGEDADETGIICAAQLSDGRIWIVDDRSCHDSPDGWARRVNELYAERSADRIIAEVNNGGELVTTVLKTVNRNLPVTAVHASRGKRVRAEPVAALYEQGRVSHVGDLSRLEDQLVSWTPEDPGSPDRMDALVWAVTALTERSGFDDFLSQLAVQGLPTDDGKAVDGLAVSSLVPQ